jgi:hypothetical protein
VQQRLSIQDSRFQPAAKQRQNSPITQSLTQTFHEPLMIEYIKEILDVRIDDPSPPSPDFLPEPIQRLLRRPLGPVPVGTVEEIRLEDRLEDELRRRFDDAIPECRHA